MHSQVWILQTYQVFVSTTEESVSLEPLGMSFSQNFQSFFKFFTEVLLNSVQGNFCNTILVLSLLISSRGRRNVLPSSGRRTVGGLKRLHDVSRSCSKVGVSIITTPLWHMGGVVALGSPLPLIEMILTPTLEQGVHSSFSRIKHKSERVPCVI